MSRLPTEAEFLNDVREHQMQVIRDDGDYRHVRFSRPGTYCYQFDLITWHGYLAYSGDMGCYVFSRIRDMFEFFRGKPEGPLSINLGYWHEKVEAQARHDGVVEHSAERFRECVLEDSKDAPEDVKQAIELEVLSHADEEHEAWQAVMNFNHNGWHFQDFWEHKCTEYTHRYVWCCYALVWGIRQYDLAKAAKPERRARAWETRSGLPPDAMRVCMPLKELREWRARETKACHVNLAAEIERLRCDKANDEHVHEWLDISTHDRLREKCKTCPAEREPTGPEQDMARMPATLPLSDQPAFAQFAKYIALEMPEGTVIGDPAWWAPRLWRFARYANGFDANELLARISKLEHELRRASHHLGWLADYHLTTDYSKVEARKLAGEYWSAQSDGAVKSSDDTGKP